MLKRQQPKAKGKCKWLWASERGGESGANGASEANGLGQLGINFWHNYNAINLITLNN